MSNNTTLNTGSGGDVIQTEDNAGVKTQIVKPAFGLAGTVTLVSTTNPLPVGDAGGSLTVDNAGTFAVQAAATLAAETTKVIGTVNIAAAQTLATVTTVGAVTAITNALPAGTNAIGKLSANGGVTIGDVNVISQIPGTGATNLGKAEDAAHTSGDVGIMALAVRNDAGGALAGTTGDYIPLTTDSSGALRVTGGSGGTAIADAAAFTRGSTSVTPFAGVVETSAPTLTNGNTGAASITTGGAIRVDVTSGGIPGFAEDVASVGGEQGVLAMGVRQDTQASNTSADGDYTYSKYNSVGSLYVSTSHIGANAVSTGNGVSGTGVQRVTLASDSTGILAAVTNVATIGTSVTPGTAATNLGKAEDAAAASGDTGVAIFAVRRDTPSSDVSAAGDYATLQVDATGQLWTRASAQTTGGYTPTSVVSAATTNATSLKASAGTVGAVTVSNINAAMRYLKFYNKASAPTVGTDTPVYVIPIPGNTAGAGCTISFPCGLNFSTGIAWALTTGPTVADTGAVAASEIIVSIASI
jgi:hypothetical protein